MCSVHKETCSNGRLRCGICNSILTSQRFLCDHVKMEHSIDLNIINLSFASEEKLQQWRTTVEEFGRFRFEYKMSFLYLYFYGILLFRFINSSSMRTTQKSTVEYLRCFRSGEKSNKVRISSRVSHANKVKLKVLWHITARKCACHEYQKMWVLCLNRL